MGLLSFRLVAVSAVGLVIASTVLSQRTVNRDSNTAIALSMARSADDVSFLADKDFGYFCYFAAYSFGPTKQGNPYFHSDFAQLNQRIINGYADELPPRDGVALLFLFDKGQRLRAALTLRERRGYLRWTVKSGPEFQEFCASKDQVTIRTLERGSFVLLRFEKYSFSD